jgi:flagellar hook protein FlgE
MSFDIALSGIGAVNSSLETISNNIANSGTYGFKSSRANFASLYAGEHPNGAEVSSQSQSIEKGGGMVNTGRGMDAMIQGKGYFAVREPSGQEVYSRVGVFNVNKDGFVVDGMGRKVQGYGSVVDGSGKPVEGALGGLGDLKVHTGQIPAAASDKLDFNGNLSSDWTKPATATFNQNDPTSFNHSITSVVYDSLGTKHSVTQYFVKAAPNEVNVHYSFDGKPAGGGTTLQFDGATGQLTAGSSRKANLGPLSVDTGAASLSFAINYGDTTQFTGDTTTRTNAANGYASGSMTGTSIGEDGGVIATYSNGQKQRVGTLALATFADESALKPVNDTSWTASAATGAALFAAPGTATAAKLTTGSLEQSNVDMTGELVSLMSAQRNYQANTKVISTENQMMQALMQAV